MVKTLVHRLPRSFAFRMVHHSMVHLVFDHKYFLQRKAILDIPKFKKKKRPSYLSLTSGPCIVQLWWMECIECDLILI